MASRLLLPIQDLKDISIDSVYDCIISPKLEEFLKGNGSNEKALMRVRDELIKILDIPMRIAKERGTSAIIEAEIRCIIGAAFHARKSEKIDFNIETDIYNVLMKN